LIEGRPPPNTHDLEKLFEMLSKESKAEIERDTDVPKQQATSNSFHVWKYPGLPPPVVTFRSILHGSRNVFEGVRYIHEKTTLDDGEVWSAQAIMLAVRKRLCGIHPEWENFQFVNRKPETSSGS
jgi:hypothetical protein